MSNIHLPNVHRQIELWIYDTCPLEELSSNLSMWELNDAQPRNNKYPIIIFMSHFMHSIDLVLIVSHLFSNKFQYYPHELPPICLY